MWPVTALSDTRSTYRTIARGRDPSMDTLGTAPVYGRPVIDMDASDVNVADAM